MQLTFEDLERAYVEQFGNITSKKDMTRFFNMARKLGLRKRVYTPFKKAAAFIKYDERDESPGLPQNKTANDVGKLYTRDGVDVWRMIGFCEYPSAIFENLDTKERRQGAAHSQLVQSFRPWVCLTVKERAAQCD